MAYTLPPQAYINKFIPKNKFFEKAVVSTKLKKEFADKIQKITWKYKLAQETIGILKTATVEEIQIFEIQLKQKVIPKNVLKLIDKAIPYPILYKFIYEDAKAYGISYTEGSDYNYYFSDWDTDMSFDITGVNLERVYQKIITAFIVPTDVVHEDFAAIVSKDNQKKQLEKEIETLHNKLSKEKQFNKKVELNKELQTKKKRLELLL